MYRISPPLISVWGGTVIEAIASIPDFTGISQDLRWSSDRILFVKCLILKGRGHILHVCTDCTLWIVALFCKQCIYTVVAKIGQMRVRQERVDALRTTAFQTMIPANIKYSQIAVSVGQSLLHLHCIWLGLARTIYIRCIYGIFGREITKYTVVYGAYIRFWPTLHMTVPLCWRPPSALHMTVPLCWRPA